MKLAPSEARSVVFYMALSGNGTPATGDKYIYSDAFDSSDSAKAASKSDASNGLVVISPYAADETPKASENAASLPEAAPKQPEVSEKPAASTDADYYIMNMTKEQLTPEYIQALIERIEELEKDTSAVSRQELLQLNAELDAILMYLRQ